MSFENFRRDSDGPWPSWHSLKMYIVSSTIHLFDRNSLGFRAVLG